MSQALLRLLQALCSNPGPLFPLGKWGCLGVLCEALPGPSTRAGASWLLPGGEHFLGYFPFPGVGALSFGGLWLLLTGVPEPQSCRIWIKVSCLKAEALALGTGFFLFMSDHHPPCLWVGVVTRGCSESVFGD